MAAPTITVDDVQQQFQVVLGLLHQVPRLRVEKEKISEVSVQRDLRLFLPF